jgi:hypothetical protein
MNLGTKIFNKVLDEFSIILRELYTMTMGNVSREYKDGSTTQIKVIRSTNKMKEEKKNMIILNDAEKA